MTTTTQPRSVRHVAPPAVMKCPRISPFSQTACGGRMFFETGFGRDAADSYACVNCSHSIPVGRRTRIRGGKYR